MSDTPKPASLRLVKRPSEVMPPASSMEERVTLPDGPITERIDSVPAAKNGLELDLPIEIFLPDEELATLCEPMDAAYLLIEGRVAIYALDGRGEPMASPIRELTTGDVVNAELFTAKGSCGMDSEFTVKAKTPVRAYVLTLEDILDRRVPELELRKRVSMIANALAGYAVDAANQRVRNHSDVDLYDKALDDVRDNARELEKSVSDLARKNESLTQEITALNAVNRQLTIGAVEKAVRQRLHEIEVENRRLKEQNRKLTKKNGELEATSKSQMDYVASVTEEVVEYERLRDLLGLESTDPNRLVEELRRTFLNLYQLHNPKLQNLGVLGLGELGKLENKEHLPDALTEEEIEQAASATIPSDPGKDPGPTK